MKKVALGCLVIGGGLVGLLVLLVVIVAISGAGKHSAASDAIKSNRSTPAPMTISTLAVGNTAQTKELAITILEMTDPYRSPNQFTQPKAGNRFVYFHMGAKNIDKTDHTVSSYNFQLRTSDGHIYKEQYVNTGGDEFRSLKLSGGDVTEGDIVFEVPLDAKIASLRFDNGIFSQDMQWNVQ